MKKMFSIVYISSVLRIFILSIFGFFVSFLIASLLSSLITSVFRLMYAAIYFTNPSFFEFAGIIPFIMIMTLIGSFPLLLLIYFPLSLYMFKKMHYKINYIIAGILLSLLNLWLVEQNSSNFFSSADTDGIKYFLAITACGFTGAFTGRFHYYFYQEIAK